MSGRKPSENEEEYFARLELERRRAWEKERAAKMQTGEIENLKLLHYMKCPKCGMDLHGFDLHGIKLDRCVSCNGTWFDQGELEQLIEKEHGMLGRIASIFK